MAPDRNTRRSLEYLLHLVIVITLLEAVSGQATCASRRCKIQLDEGETQEVTFPGSVDTAVDSLDEIRWTITARNNRNRILIVIKDINWPKTDLKFENQNPNSIAIRHDGKVFPIFPEYNTKIIKSGIFLSGTHSIVMEMDIPIVAELPSIPSFQMQFTAYSVKELFRCKLSDTSCDKDATLRWKQSSEGYIYKGSNTADEGTLTVHLPQGIQIDGKGFLSFGYLFDYQGISGSSGGQSRDEEGRVTVECPGSQKFGISSDGFTEAMVECHLEDSSITFTARGSLHLVITDVDIHDASVSAAVVDPEPSSDTSVLPVVAGISVFVGAVVIVIICIAIVRRKRSQSALERKPKATVDKGRYNGGFQSGSGRTFEGPDERTYHYPSFPISPPPKHGETIYQEIEKKGQKSSTNVKDFGDQETGKNAYDLLELPGDGSLDSNKKAKSTEKLPLQGSPLVSRCRTRSMGYETLDGTAESTPSSSVKKSPLITAKNTSENETKQPKPARVECDYLEILSEEEIENLKMQDKNGQPVLAHQDLYQHLKRQDIPFHAPTQALTTEKSSSEGTDITEENYGKLDIAADSPPAGPNYFVLDADTDC